MEKKFDIVVIGQLTLDDVVLYDAPPKLDSPGGAGLYALGSIVMWGQDYCGFVTRRGIDNDEMGIVEKLAAGRVDFTGVVDINAPSIHIWNMFDRKGHRYFVKQRWGSDDDLMGIYSEDIPPHYLSGSNHFLVVAFPFKWQEEVIQALPEDAVILVDPHFAGINPENRGRWEKLLKKTTVFMPSEDELIRFFEIEQQSELKNYIPYLKEIADMGPEVVCVKVGPRGALLYERSSRRVWHVPAYPSKVVDVTGCGDSFCGGFFSSYAKDKDVYNAALCGSVSASFNIEKHGSLTNFKEKITDVNKRLEEFKVQLGEPDSHLL